MKSFCCFIFSLLCWPTLLLAQSDLAIQEAFRTYGVRSDATEVIIEGHRLKPYRLSRFHSLEIKSPPPACVKAVEQMVQSDTQHSLHSEGRLGQGTNGSAFFEIPCRRHQHAYIFYRLTEQKLVLIYIEGQAGLKELKSNFKKDNK